ncbi:MAG TPA: hypothetical protein DF613_15430 [Lachnospiraceae bacterium]|nr:hypothetical protein [Lachnospiraceae bacterium]
MKRAVWKTGMAVVLFLTMFLGSRSAAVSASSPAKVTVTVRTQHRKAYEVLKRINKARKSAGLKPLSMDKTLLENALSRAGECSVYYSHRRANGKVWHTAITKKYVYAGENVGFGFTEAQAVTEAWMASPSHRKNIMNGRYTCVGIGCVAINGVTYWAQEFTDGRAKKVSRPADKKKNMKIAVSEDVLLPKWTREKLTMDQGESGTVSLILKNVGYDGLTVQVAASGVRYSTSDKSVVTVTSGGKIRAVGAGKASVKVRLAGNGRVCRVYDITVTE